MRWLVVTGLVIPLAVLTGCARGDLSVKGDDGKPAITAIVEIDAK